MFKSNHDHSIINLCILTAVAGQWSPWENVGMCSTSCGRGLIHQTRTCQGLQNEGATCPGRKVRDQPCSESPVPCDGECMSLNFNCKICSLDKC